MQQNKRQTVTLNNGNQNPTQAIKQAIFCPHQLVLDLNILHMYAGVALSQVHASHLQVLGKVEFFPPQFMLYLLIQSLVNYELQVLVLLLTSYFLVVCFMLTIYC